MSPHAHTVPSSLSTTVWFAPTETLEDATASSVFVTFTTNTPSLLLIGFVTVITALLYAPASVGCNVPDVLGSTTVITSELDDLNVAPVTFDLSPDISRTKPLSYTS